MRNVRKDVNGAGRGNGEFGRLLAGFRFDRGLSQEELAFRSGMSVRAIRDLERGKVDRPRQASVSLLANALALNDPERAAFKDAVGMLLRGIDGRPEMRRVQRQIVPCQLPPDIQDFTGRELALERLHRRVTGREDAATAALFTAVVGKAGVGKTTLAVYAAHQLRPWFPDGQLYVSLRGAEAQALEPADVLGRFLRALGVESHGVPDDVDSRIGLYRSLMADRRMIVLLDNAADEAQVRPLLPTGAGNLVLITSRARLAGLSLAAK
jgi:transcriptional regulator with XRE-family HTH domain